MIRGSIAVRAFAEFVFASGDLYPPNAGRTVEAEEGIQRQREAQAPRVSEDPCYQTEVPLKLSFDCAGTVRTLSGRVDGLSEQGHRVLIEEFKCRGALPAAPDPVDRAQAWLYAGLHAVNASTPPASYEVSVVYVHAESGAERSFRETAAMAAVEDTLRMALLCYAARMERHRRRTSARDDWSRELAFPMPQFRPSQRAIARRVYQTLTSGGNLLLEAPTGSGKSLAVLYPAIRAQRDDAQLFFLTSRNAGARAALATARQLDPRSSHLVIIELTAKEKICPVEGMPCDATRCPNAAGYFDRAPAAVNALLDARTGDRQTVEHVAATHQVCPFELSLDAALWADLIIGDYNYLLDPVVRLKRFSGHREMHMLVDEAHQLSTRVSDMLTVQASRAVVREAAKLPHDQLARRVASVDRALTRLRRTHGEGEHEIADVSSIERAFKRLTETVAAEEGVLEQLPALQPLYFTALRWLRSATWYDAGRFAHVLKVDGREVELTRLCLDPAAYITEIFDSHAGIVRFSGTLTPLPLYQRLHGGAEQPAERAQTPFGDHQALVLTVPDVPTFYRQRAAGIASLVDLINALRAARRGRYLVALPSYQYLAQVADAFVCGEDTYVQRPGMLKDETEDMLEAFGAAEQGLLFIVSGGVLGESVDFTHCALCGVVLVGLGLPPPSIERNLIARHYDDVEGAGWGQMVAYTQPALVKNIQAAGRLIRSPEDFGIICLVDPRFASTEVQRFFPSHWNPRTVRAAEVPSLAANFWQGVP